MPVQDNDDKRITNQLHTVEEQLEDDLNMIDGIINNGSKEEINKARVVLREGIKNMESLAENPFVSEEVRAVVAGELEKMRKQLELLDSADEIEVESWLSDMLEKDNDVCRNWQNYPNRWCKRKWQISDYRFRISCISLQTNIALFHSKSSYIQLQLKLMDNWFRQCCSTQKTPYKNLQVWLYSYSNSCE